MYASLLLYGSHARGDHNLHSDIDLLGIKTDGSIKFRPEKQQVTLHEYPFYFLEEKAFAGDLFLLHLVTEAVALADDLNLLGSLKKSFQFKDSYESEKKEAAAVFWYCEYASDVAPEDKLRKRLTWAMRTTLIADAANKGQAIFSSKSLEEYSNIGDLKEILDNRENVSYDRLKLAAKKVLSKYYRQIKPENLSRDYVVKWMNSKGAVARSTPAMFESVAKRDFFHDFYM
ncbi:MAG: hypothetical protein ACSHXY_14230 [Alphaproteobacteria bacterium]